MLFITDQVYIQYQQAVQAHQQWLSDHSTSAASAVAAAAAEHILHTYDTAMRGMREGLASSLTEYDLHAMAVGSLLLWLVNLGGILTNT